MWTSVVWLFEFMKTCGFQLFKYFRIRKLVCSSSWKNQKRIDGSSYFENPKKSMIFNERISPPPQKRSQRVSSLTFSYISEPWLHTKLTSLNILRMDEKVDIIDGYHLSITHSKNRPNTDDASKSPDIWIKNPSINASLLGRNFYAKFTLEKTKTFKISPIVLSKKK